MLLNNSQYNSLCEKIKVTPNYKNGHQDCNSRYQDYFEKVLSYISGNNPTRVVCFFLEACPSNTQNYIFNFDKGINSKNDSYLWNIYTGFNGNPVNGMKKDNCLFALLEHKTNDGENIPVIIFDLFPFHGIDLNGYRINICNQINNADLLQDVKHYISQIQKRKKLFLFGVPYTIWNFAGGYGDGSLYRNSGLVDSGLLGDFYNKSIVINVGGQNISSQAIKMWRSAEGIL